VNGVGIQGWTKPNVERYAMSQQTLQLPLFGHFLKFYMQQAV
jgi:hypothetical protein